MSSFFGFNSFRVAFAAGLTFTYNSIEYSFAFFVLINFVQIFQRTEEIIVTSFGGYHSGFNVGLNASEAINLATENTWIKNFALYKFCDCL